MSRRENGVYNLINTIDINFYLKRTLKYSR